MTPEAPYEYTDHDLLSEPETYEYSEVYGKPFLDAYREDRIEVLEVIEVTLASTDGSDATGIDGWGRIVATFDCDLTETVLGHLPDLATVRGDEPIEASATPRLQAGTAEPPVNTVAVCLALVGFPDEEPVAGEAASAWLDRLTKRFEVDKVLYEAYDADVRPVAEVHAPLVAYPLLAIGALVSHDRTGNLKHLNVALKLCDLLSSRHERVSDSGVLALTALAIAAELDAVGALSASVGVEH